MTACGNPVSPLHDAIKPLLQVAPSGICLFDRDSTGEILVFRPRFGIWLSIYGLPSAQRRDEYRAVEWGTKCIDDISEVHFFPSRWELLTWVEQMFHAAT